MKRAFARTLKNLAANDPSIFLLTADLGFKLFDDFRSSFPDRFINVGVAEANMIGVATGLTLSGKKVYCYSMIPFLTMRALEQIRVGICYHKLSVKLIGVGSGFMYGLEGMTHHAIEDLAIMRSLPNMTVVAPGDSQEVVGVIEESAGYEGPLYIRLAGNDDPAVHSDEISFRIGRGIFLKRGSDLSVIATGGMLHMAKLIVDQLESRGIDTTLLSMHTIKPLDSGIIRDCAGVSKAIFTIEEHSEIGGLGSAVAECLFFSGWHGRFVKFALPDRYCEDIGCVDYLREKSGLSSEKILKRILAEWEQCA